MPRLKSDLHILAAEDSPSDVDLLEMAMGRCGVTPLSFIIVPDGQAIIDYLQGTPPFDTADRHVPDIILLDLKMPRLSGFEVLEWLKKDPHWSVIPAMIMSGSSLPEDVLRAYRLGANGYFEKPCEFAHFKELLLSIVTFWSRAKRPPIT